ncbi:MAG: hypothetical protein R3F11_19435 [Verrucomicrobiales bacterium]
MPSTSLGNPKLCWYRLRDRTRPLRGARGCRRYAALRCLANKWIRVPFRCWKTREPYDENRYIAALRKAGSPLVPRIDPPPGKGG